MGYNLLIDEVYGIVTDLLTIYQIPGTSKREMVKISDVKFSPREIFF